ncbi:MAG: group 1 truncated hemoglobin [Nitrospirae bacterium]|nr:MAG: group 1 truncated hemoglobin [Nitrospirota bacterium]
MSITGRSWLYRFSASLLFVGLIGCATMSRTDSAPSHASLYERLGGKAAIQKVVDTFVANVAEDARINSRFATTDIPRLKRHLVDQICEATGGPCTYTGRDMKTAHAGMGITNAEFDALVEDLVAALNTHQVPQHEQQELLALLAPMRKDIVEQP